jgi:hypothetical protein
MRAIAAAIVRHGQAARMLLADDQPTLGAIRRFFALTPGDEGLAVDALVAACAADVAAGCSPSGQASVTARRVAELIGAYFADPRRFVPPPLLAGGDVVRELPHVRGPQIGRILRAVRAAQLDGQIATRAEALALARQIGSE